MIIQHHAAECGLTCIVIAAKIFGDNRSLPRWRSLLGSTPRGANLGILMALADRAGFATRPLRLDVEELHNLHLPAILHWDMNHYVVLSKVTAKGVIILDPAVGERRLNFEAVSKHFTGVALELRPTNAFKPETKTDPVRLSDLWSRASGLFGSLGMVVALALALQAVALLLPLVNQVAIDEALVKGDLDFLNLLALGGALLLAAQFALGVLRGLVATYVTSQLTFQMRSNLLRHALRLPIAWFERRHLGDIMSRFNSLAPVQDLLVGGVVAVTVDGLMAVAALIVMAIYAPVLAAVVLASLLVHIAIQAAAFEPIRRMTMESVQAQARADSVFLETIRAARAFRLFGNEAERHAIWQNAYGDVVTQMTRLQNWGAWGQAGLLLRQGAEMLLVFYLGARLVNGGDLSLGMLMAFLAYRQNFTTAASSLVNQAFRYKLLDLHLERLADIVHEQPEAPGEANSFLSPSDQGAPMAFSLRGLNFRYGAYEPWILRGIDLDVRPGEFIALVGPSGGGKSSLIKLLCGIHAPDEGEILIDGQILRPGNLAEMRARLGIVMQDDHLLAGTIADNITFFDAEPDQERIEAAAKQAVIHDEIMATPMAYMTLIGDMGSTLSGGQRQRLLLARAFYRKPSLLILDEGTANLDIGLERQIMANFAALKITRIVAAHRPSAIEGADRVFLVQGGSMHEIAKDAAINHVIALREASPA